MFYWPRRSYLGSYWANFSSRPHVEDLSTGLDFRKGQFISFDTAEMKPQEETSYRAWVKQLGVETHTRKLKSCKCFETLRRLPREFCSVSQQSQPLRLHIWSKRRNVTVKTLPLSHFSDHLNTLIYKSKPVNLLKWIYLEKTNETDVVKPSFLLVFCSDHVLQSGRPDDRTWFAGLLMSGKRGPTVLVFNYNQTADGLHDPLQVLSHRQVTGNTSTSVYAAQLFLTRKNTETLTTN